MKAISLVSALIFPIMANAIEVPHKFADGQRTSAEQMNENFEALASEINNIKNYTGDLHFKNYEYSPTTKKYIIGSSESTGYECDELGECKEYLAQKNTQYIKVESVTTECGTYDLPILHYEHIQFSPDGSILDERISKRADFQTLKSKFVETGKASNIPVQVMIEDKIYAYNDENNQLEINKGKYYVEIKVLLESSGIYQNLDFETTDDFMTIADIEDVLSAIQKQ